MKNSSDRGEGYQVKCALVGNFTTEIDGKKDEYKVNWEVNFTLENVEYAVRMVAGSIAQVADTIARDGLSKKKVSA